MLVQQHATEMYRVVAAIVGESDARDVIQETFVAAWTQLPRLRQPDAFASWLRRICVNEAESGVDKDRDAGLLPIRPKCPANST